MELPHNYLKYPDVMLEPYMREISSDIYTIHSYRFHGLQEFYDFLKSNPTVNYTAFGRDSLSSIDGRASFAGKPYSTAVEDLIKDVDPGYQEYLKIQKKIKAKNGITHKYNSMKSIAGGSVDSSAYSAGSPEIYKVSRIVKKPKFITIDTQIAYYWGTEMTQVFNRALIITNIIRALEKQGYSVNVNAFMLVACDDEMIQAVFEVKRHGGQINYQTLYKSLVKVEFFRRLCFRLMEVSDVTNGWSSGYGHTCDEGLVRKVLNLKDDDLYFDQPSEMGITGIKLDFDFKNVVDCLKLQDVIDVNREVEHLKQGIKALEKKK